MDLKINSRKVVASVMALSIVASGVISSEASVFSKIVPTNTISASAATNLTYQGFEYRIKSDNTINILKYNGKSANVVIPEKINNITVTGMTSELFKNNTTITSITIPKGITEISMYCFKGATNLNSVTIKGNVTEIGREAFSHTKSLKQISLPKSVNTIGREAFAGSGLESIKILKPDSASEMKIAELAFANCLNLKTVELPESLKKLERFTFTSCSSLTSINFPKTLNTLESDVFKGCSSFKSITIPNTITNLSIDVFSDCTSLENINVPNVEVFEKLLSNNCLRNTKLSKINGEPIVTYKNQRYSPVSQPIIKDEYYQPIQKNFEKVDEDNIKFFEDYLKTEIRYIVQTNTTQYMTEGQKIKALHDWVCNKVDYAYDSNGNPDPSSKNHVDSSVFFRDTTVCDGYARALTLLLREAGIEAYFIHNPGVHAWCMVKLGNSYFHVDSCHDGQSSTTNYSHFLKSDNDIKKCSAGHSSWKIGKPINSRINYTISPMPACQYSIGDVNMDGKITKADVSTIQNYLLKKITLSNTAKLLADANLDGKIDMSDAVTLVQQYPECR